jgi:hypothetical protein
VIVDNETFPQIKKFERQAEDSTKVEAALEQSKKNFWSFSKKT